MYNNVVWVGRVLVFVQNLEYFLTFRVIPSTLLQGETKLECERPQLHAHIMILLRPDDEYCDVLETLVACKFST